MTDRRELNQKRLQKSIKFKCDGSFNTLTAMISDSGKVPIENENWDDFYIILKEKSDNEKDVLVATIGLNGIVKNVILHAILKAKIGEVNREITRDLIFSKSLSEYHLEFPSVYTDISSNIEKKSFEFKYNFSYDPLFKPDFISYAVVPSVV